LRIYPDMLLNFSPCSLLVSSRHVIYSMWSVETDRHGERENVRNRSLFIISRRLKNLSICYDGPLHSKDYRLMILTWVVSMWSSSKKRYEWYITYIQLSTFSKEQSSLHHLRRLFLSSSFHYHHQRMTSGECFFINLMCSIYMIHEFECWSIHLPNTYKHTYLLGNVVIHSDFMCIFFWEWPV